MKIDGPLKKGCSTKLLLFHCSKELQAWETLFKKKDTPAQVFSFDNYEVLL